jgi:biopolymer transport protein ExbB/TolQ
MDARSKIILYILLVMIAILTFNIRNAREIKKFVESILQENDTKKSYENAGDSTKKSYLTEEQKAFVRKYVSSRNYNYAKRKLEQLGFKNVRMRKVREIIIIEFEGGKEVIPMTPST